MSYDTDERSVHDGLPQELYVIATPSQTWRLTSSEQDIVWSSNTYSAVPLSRGNVIPPLVTESKELTVTMPVDHDVALELLEKGIPLQDVTITISRIHPTASSAREIWRGYIAGATTDDQFLRIRTLRDLEDTFAIQLPIAKGSRMCQHQLYDAGCKVDRTAHDQNALVVLVTGGTDLTVNWSGSPPGIGWATGGDVVSSSGAERRSVIGQTATHIIIDVPFHSSPQGTTVTVHAGCNHTILECRDKFTNVPNFGGHPQMPNSRPTAPRGFGIIVQE